MKKKSAFTLIELLVVIAIIGTLVTISIVALSNARAKSRDAKRAGDIKQVSTALELFFNDNNRYPTVAEWEARELLSTSTGSTSTYMQIIPAATVPVDGVCTPTQNSLVYIPTEDGGSYTISFCLGSNTGTLTPGPKCLTPGGVIDRDCFVCGDQISAGTIAGHTCNTGAPDYDKCTYNTVLIGEQCFMKENLNVGTMVLGSVNQGNYSAGIEKYCYNNNLLITDNVTPHNYCATDGGLYQLHMAMAKDQSCDAVDCTASPSDSCCFVSDRGICPVGWHLPSDVEQNTLENYLKDDGQACDANRQAGYDCATAGTKMKNAAGFSCLLVGRRNSNNTFTGWGTYGRFWSVSTIGLDAWYRMVYSGNTTVGRYHLPRTYGLPIRCIKD